jgi:hypothetical protein
LQASFISFVTCSALPSKTASSGIYETTVFFAADFLKKYCFQQCTSIRLLICQRLWNAESYSAAEKQEKGFFQQSSAIRSLI